MPADRAPLGHPRLGPAQTGITRGSDRRGVGSGRTKGQSAQCDNRQEAWDQTSPQGTDGRTDGASMVRTEVCHLLSAPPEHRRWPTECAADGPGDQQMPSAGTRRLTASRIVDPHILDMSGRPPGNRQPIPSRISYLGSHHSATAARCTGWAEAAGRLNRLLLCWPSPIDSWPEHALPRLAFRFVDTLARVMTGCQSHADWRWRVPAAGGWLG